MSECFEYYRSILTGKSASFTKNSASVNATTQKKGNTISILTTLCKVFGRAFIFGFILKLAQDLLAFVPPQLLRLIIKFVEDSNPETTANDRPMLHDSQPLWHGIFYALLLFIVLTLQALLLARHSQCQYAVGMRMRSAVIGAIYRKAMMLSNRARKESTVGEIVNLMAVDAERFLDVPIFISIFLSAVIHIVLAMYFLWDFLGPPVLAGELVGKIKMLKNTQFSFE